MNQTPKEIAEKMSPEQRWTLCKLDDHWWNVRRLEELECDVRTLDVLTRLGVAQESCLRTGDNYCRSFGFAWSITKLGLAVREEIVRGSWK